MLNRSTQLLRASPCLNSFLKYLWIRSLFNALSLVKEKIKIYLNVMVMIKILSMCLHPVALTLCAWTQILHYIKMFNKFENCT